MCIFQKANSSRYGSFSTKRFIDVPRGSPLQELLLTILKFYIFKFQEEAFLKDCFLYLDGCYNTRMLRMAMNVSWREKIRNEVLDGHLPRVTDKIRERRLRLAGHCVRHSELEVSVVLREPTQGKSNRGSQRPTYVDMLMRDTELESTVELGSLMQDKCRWRAMARGTST